MPATFLTAVLPFFVRFVVSAFSDILRIKKKHPKIMMNKTNNMPTDLPMLPFVFLLNLFSIKAFFALPVNPVYSTRDPGNSPAGHRINSFRYGFVFIARSTQYRETRLPEHAIPRDPFIRSAHLSSALTSGISSFSIISSILLKLLSSGSLKRFSILSDTRPI